MSCGGTFPRTQFLGATISQYQASAGWNGEQGQLQAYVVNDTCVGGGVAYANDGNGSASIATADSFNPPPLGYPVTFRFSGFRFSGILRDWKEIDDAQGPKMYEVNVVDPRDIIDGTQVILNGYIGDTYGVPNLINAFGWLEHYLGGSCTDYTSTIYPPSGFNVILRYIPAGAFGGADDRGGLPWWQIRLALTSLLNTAPGGSSFGSVLKYRDHNYYVDLTDLPPLDDWVRFGSDSMSLGEIIHEVCELTSHDYFYSLVNHNTIKVNVVDRSSQATDLSAQNVDAATGVEINGRLGLGSIGDAIGTARGKSTLSRGIELRHSYTNAFLTGEYRQDIWQTDLILSDYNSTIWPYWGKDPISDSYIIGRGVAYDNLPVDTEHYFDVPVDGWGIPGLTGFWRITTTEMRFALEGETQWRNFILTRQPALAVSFGFASEDELPDTNTTHFHMLRAGSSREQHIQATSRRQAQNAAYEGWLWDRVTQIYEHVHQYARTYFGRQFMVRLPYLCMKLDANTPYTLQTNWRPARDGGWYSGSVLGLAPGSVFLENFRQNDGKILAFVGFQSFYPLDLSDISNVDDFIQTNPYTAYVKCQVDDFIQFGAADWRAIITLPGIVKIWRPNDTLSQILGLKTMCRMKYGDGEIPDDALENIGKQPGGDKIQYRLHPLPQTPISAAVPMQSTRLTYGPWGATVGDLDDVSTNTAGKTVYERDASFAPWNFGSTGRMNAAGDAWAISRLSDHYVSEQGSVTIADAPNIQLGEALFGSGPLVTRIETRVTGDNSAITTTYVMKTYTPDYGKIGQHTIAAIKRTGMYARQANRMFKRWALDRHNQLRDRIRTYWKNLPKPSRYNPTSSHDILMGTAMPNAAYAFPDYLVDGHISHQVAVTELHKSLPEFRALDDRQYGRMAAMDINGLLRPFSTRPGDDDEIDLPAFEASSAPSGEFNEQGDQYKYPDFDIAKHTYYYSKEQVPPVYGIEPHIPITVETLSPFLSDEWSRDAEGNQFFKLGYRSPGHDIEYIARDGTYPVDLSVRQPDDYGSGYSSQNWYRGVCLKGPLVLAGWGYDIDNHPVPNHNLDYPEQASMAFDTDWLRKPHKWKCGPVDLRWDYRRKVWTAPTPIKLVRVMLLGPSLPGYYAKGIIYDEDDQWRWNGYTGGNTEIYKIDSTIGRRCTPLLTDEEYPVELASSANIIPVLNMTHHFIGYKAIVYCHWDTTKERYYIISGEDMVYQMITYEHLYPLGTGGTNYAWCSNIWSAPQAFDDGIGSRSYCRLQGVMPYVHSYYIQQPICANSHVYAYWDSGVPTGYTDVHGVQCVSSCVCYFIILQAQFRTYRTLTKLQASAIGNQVTDICVGKREAYLQAAPLEECRANFNIIPGTWPYQYSLNTDAICWSPYGGGYNTKLDINVDNYNSRCADYASSCDLYP